MEEILVTARDISRSTELRLDPHHFTLSRHIEALVADRSGIPLAYPYFELHNGMNLPATAYEQDDESTGYLYASVGAISQFSLRLSHCAPLKSPDDAPHEPDTESVAQDDEVWITRSGTPGIAWPALLAPKEDVLYPSGFLIRLRSVTRDVLPGYVAAVLNHPLWRIWSASLAAGKRQRNLSQSHLSQMRLPRVPLPTQLRIEEEYFGVLDEIAELLRDEADVMSTADAVLRSVLGINYDGVSQAKLTLDTVSLSDAVRLSPVARLDPNFHRSDLRKVASQIDSMSPHRLESLLLTDVIKSSQPEILDEDPDDEPRVVASVSLQAGHVQRDLTKPTSDDQISTAGVKALQSGDVLLAMDGYSAGKVALFDDDYAAVTDSHVGILRVGDREVARSLACFLSSSLCQAQVKLALSGSSAYQLAKPDVKALQVPEVVLRKAQEIGDRFYDALDTYQSPVQRVRRKICAAAANTGSALLEEADLTARVALALRECASADRALEALAILQPNMF